MRKITLWLLFLFASLQLEAQVTAYSFAATTGGVIDPMTGSTQLIGSGADDTASAVTPIGFTFNYAGVNYTQFSTNANALIRLGATAVTTQWTNSAANANTAAPAIMPYWDDLATGSAAGGGKVHYLLTGTAPNRKLIIEWFVTVPRATTGPANARIQCVLEETTNVIQFIYNGVVANATNSGSSIGLATSATVYNTVDVTTNTNSTSTFTTTNTAAIPDGTVYTWTPPSCSAPSGIVASGLTPTSATISWNASSPTPSNGYEYYFSTTNTPPTGAGTPEASTSVNIATLSPNTTYYVWIRSNCGGTYSSWSGVYSFSTPCNPYSIPYSEGFESGYVDQTTVAGCLIQQSVTGTQSWTANSSLTTYNRTPRTGTWNAYLRYGNEDWIFIPISLTGGTSYLVELYARQDGNVTTNSNMAISYGSSATAAAMTNVIVPATGIDTNYKRIWGTFTPSTTGTYYVGIKGFMNGTPWYISLDDILIDVAPPCLDPVNIAVSNITSSSFDLGWTDSTGGNQFDYHYVVQPQGTGAPSTFPAGNYEDGTNFINATDILISGISCTDNLNCGTTGLTSNTAYEVYVAVDCNGNWVGPFNFTTLCSSFTAPFNEPFAVNSMPSCWTPGGATAWEYGSVSGTTPGGFADYGANGVPDFNGAGGTFIGMDGSDNTNGEVSTLLSPFIDISTLTIPRLKYAVFSNNINDAAQNLLEVEVWDGAAWNLVNSVQSNLGTNWVVFTTDLTTLTISGPIQIRYTVTGVSNGGSTFYNDILIDDVTVEETPTTPPSCASNVVGTPDASCGNFNNSITWDAVSGADGYYLTIGTTPGGTDVLNNQDLGNTVMYNFVGTINTTYYFTVVPYNANGSATGCSEVSFSTNVNGCYCVSNPTSVDGQGITNVQIVATDFANTVNTSPVYNDHTATVVDMSQGINNNVQISFDTGFGYDYNIVIWIDANDNYNLEASEIVYTGLAPNTPIVTHDASFVVPASIPLGQHRMRIVATDVLQTPSNPCYNGTWGETADFTVNIVAATCSPATIASSTIVPNCGTSQFTVDIDVTSLGDGTPSITDGTSNWTISGTGVITVGPFAFGSVNLTVLHGSDNSCDFSLGNFTYTTCPPVNDDLCNAIALSIGAPATGTDYTLEGATAETNEPIPACFNGGINGSVWFSFVAPSTNVEVTTDFGGGTLTDDDTEIAVYDATGVNCSDLSTLPAAIDCNQDATAPVNTTYSSYLALSGLTPGTTYYIQVDMWGSATQGSFGIQVNDLLSTNNFDVNKFVAYPNPVKDILTLEYSSDITSVRVVNMLGQEVLAKTMNSTSTQVDMSQLAAGTYLVNVISGNVQKTIKVVKQ